MCPLYDASCDDCDEEFEYIASVNERGSVPRCPTCRSRNTVKIVGGVPMMKMRDAGWHAENGGRGRRFSQLAKHALDENCYFRSVGEAKEEAKRRGMIISDE